MELCGLGPASFAWSMVFSVHPCCGSQQGFAPFAAECHSRGSNTDVRALAIPGGSLLAHGGPRQTCLWALRPERAVCGGTGGASFSPRRDPGRWDAGRQMAAESSRGSPGRRPGRLSLFWPPAWWLHRSGLCIRTRLFRQAFPSGDLSGCGLPLAVPLLCGEIHMT